MQDPTPAWRLMLKGGAEEFLESAPWLSIFPGFAITLAVFGFNLFGDALRDLLDPKLRSRYRSLQPRLALPRSVVGRRRGTHRHASAVHRRYLLER